MSREVDPAAAGCGGRNERCSTCFQDLQSERPFSNETCEVTPTRFAGPHGFGKPFLPAVAPTIRAPRLAPDGVFLLTGTGIALPEDFTLRAGDVVTVGVGGLELRNTVASG